MAVIETWFEQDLQKPVKVRYIDGNLFSHNGNGNRIGVIVTNNGDPVTLTGTVSGYAVLADGTTVPCTGSRSGNKASILVPAAAYSPGSILISIFLTDGTTVTTLAALSSSVIMARTGNQIDPGSVVTDWTNTINAAMQSVETAAANLGNIIATPYANLTFPVPLGKYTIYNNGLYRCISPIASSEEWTAAHWTNVKLGDDVADLKSAFDKVDEALITQETITTVVTADSGVTWESGYFWGSSSGIMTKSAYASTSCAVYGNVNKGDIFRVTARSVGSAYALYLADENGNRISYFESPLGNGYYGNAEYKMPSDGVLYINTITAGYLTGSKLYQLDRVEKSYLPIITLQNKINTVENKTDRNSESLDYLINSIPTKDVFVDVLSDLVFVDGKYVSSGGTVTDYASTKYAVYGSVATGEKFMFSGRKVGSCYCILLVTDAEPVSGKYTVLDVVTEGYNETSYITDAIYTVPQNGYLIYQSLKSATLKLEKNTTFLDITALPLNGIKWVTIGDSLNEFNSTAKNNWIKYMIADTGVINTNLASSGTGFYRGIATDDHPTAANYIAKLSRIPADTQLITIAGSFNDLTTSPWPQLPIGTSSDTGTETIAGYMNDFFDALINAFPLVPIGVYMTAPWSNYHYGAERSDAYVSVLKEICLKKGIPFFDNAYYGNTLKPWNTANRTEYYTHDNGTVDGVHPNDKGHVFIYQMLKPFIESLSPKNPLADINS